ncbi:MAG TPA: ATP-binding protein, partial [Polyangiaceae bacterium]
AHEINNPLAYAITNVDVLARRIGGLAAQVRRSAENGSPIDGDEVASLLEQSVEMIGIAQEGMNRVRSIVRDLKMFARQDESVKELVDVRAVLDSTANIARGEVRQRATVVRDYGEVPLVSARSSRLGQVFLNLIVNAAQAIAEGRTDGEIRLVTRTGPNGDAIVDVVDNGTGIEERVLELIFQPFVTTKERAEGTGLGLHIARTIVRAAGGEVSVTSTPGVGTTMRVTLPPATATRVPPSTARPREERPDGARILIVDDEESIGVTLRALLSPPHDVTLTTDAGDALERVLRGEAFDVIVCDIMMPGISGIRFFELLQEKRPDLVSRVVFMTGGMHSPPVQKFLQSTKARCLEKPFTDTELEDAIARVRAEHEHVPK